MKKRFVLLSMLMLSAQTACLTKILISGQAKGTIKAGGALDPTGDTDVARTALMNGLASSEGMHILSPNDENVRFLLLRGWTSYGFGFLQDDLEDLTEGSDAWEEKKRVTKHAYERAIGYGTEILSLEDEGFRAALRNDATFKAWLDKHFDEPEDAAPLFWLATAWIARVNLLKDTPEVVAELWIGVRLAEKSMQLDPAYYNGSARLLLASYHARASMAELDESKRMFEDALRASKRQLLSVQVNYATRYACMKNDRVLYESLIDEALKFDETRPEVATLRLSNTMAKKKAKRALRKDSLAACGFDPNQASSAGKTKSNLEAGEVSPDDFLKPATPTPPPSPSIPPVPSSALPPVAPLTTQQIPKAPPPPPSVKPKLPAAPAPKLSPAF
jgi:hypothetical protein